MYIDYVSVKLQREGNDMSGKKLQCPICSGGGVVAVHKGTRDDGTVDVYECSACGTKFLDIPKMEHDYEHGFVYENDPLSDLDIEERLRWFHEDDFRRYQMVRTLCTGKKVLDFGCGFGGFLHYISEVAGVCSGVELGENEREYLNKKGIRCFRTIDDTEGKFDIITLFHVFEHLSNPEKWLEKFSDYLEPGGYLVIEVPNANDILLSLYENEKFADFTYWSAHLFLYTMKSLTMLINRVGKYDIVSPGQVQRYSIANHLMWLAKGVPGGHKDWNYLDSEELNKAYAEKLSQLQMCDTLFFVLSRR